MAAAWTTPPARTTRRASPSARTRSARSSRWYSGPSSSTASTDPSGRSRERASPTAVSTRPPWRARDLVDVVGDEVSVHHLVAGVDEPVGVAAGTTTDVGDDGPGRRAASVAGPRPCARTRPARPAREPVTLLVAGVVRLQRVVGHAASCPLTRRHRQPVPGLVAADDECVERAGTGRAHRPARVVRLGAARPRHHDPGLRGRRGRDAGGVRGRRSRSGRVEVVRRPWGLRW